MRVNRSLVILVLGLWTFAQVLMWATHSGLGQGHAADGARVAQVDAHDHGHGDSARPDSHGQARDHGTGHGPDPADVPVHCDVGCLMISAGLAGFVFHPPLSPGHPSGVGSDPSEQPHSLTLPPPETFA
jgi:ABC-type nickel/cobalt efflux system permease component RcnA